MSDAQVSASTSQGSSTRTLGWFADDALLPLIEINLQCLKSLQEMAAREAGDSEPAMLAELRDVWRALPEEALQRAARHPCLLADAGFGDAIRWNALTLAVQDAQRTADAGCFTQSASQPFVRRVLTYAWHLARADRQMARIVLGVTPQSAHGICALSFADLDVIIEQCAHWVRPRWENQPRVWRRILAGDARADAGALQGLQNLQGLQLMAAAIVGPKLPPVSARKPPSSLRPRKR